MDGYSLSRQWFEWCFENPEKVSPNHCALYFFIIEQCNRLGWKEKFGLPMEVAKEAIGIKNFRTYSKTFDDLVAWGFITVQQKSKNQYSATVVAIVKNTKAHTKALSKALSKQVQNQSQSTVCIDKPINNKPINLELLNISFDQFWNLYDKKKGSKDKCEKLWEKLTDEERQKAMDHIPVYQNEQPDKQFRKNPEGYLKDKRFNDEKNLNDHANTQSRFSGTANRPRQSRRSEAAAVAIFNNVSAELGMESR